MDLDDAIAQLYRTPTVDFVTAREQLVSELKASGEKGAAADVHRLRRPTAVAWAVNQVAHDDPAGIAALLDVTARLGASQAAAGSDAQAFRAASRERRDVLARVAEAANARMEGAGVRGDKTDEIVALLDAASLDPDASAVLVQGRLTTAPERAAGFDTVFGSEPVEEPDGVAADRGASERAAELAAGERAVTRARDRFEKASRAAGDAEARVARLEDELETARRRAGEASSVLEAARSAVAEAEEALNRTFE